MSRAISIAAVVVLAGVLVLSGGGCSGGNLDAEFKQEFESQGVPVKSISVDVTPHEARIMMDRMILDSHGISNVRDEELIHATVTLENGEEVSAVKFDGKIYTYEN